MAVNMMPINPSVMLLDPQSSSGSARRNSNTESTSQGTQRASVNQDALIAENPLSRLSDNFEDSTRIAEDPVNRSRESGQTSREPVYSRYQLESARLENEAQRAADFEQGSTRRPPDQLAQLSETSERGSIVDVFA
ncbi:MAG: hypothetical protein C9356_10585 [Oleiphilus sp.]|nr:MAG: hypothetical protein C9356_10585 [Oleiphilus sp.]